MLIDRSFVVLRDLGLAIRSLRRTPGFALIAIITLGLGICASTSAFSVLNEVFLRPLPFRDTERLDRIYRVTAQNSRGTFSPADYLDLKSQESGYGEITGYALTDMSLAAPGEPAEMAIGLRVSANFFPMLGTAPQHGRVFRLDETVVGKDHVLVLSYHYWQKRFGGDPGVVGRTVRVDGATHEIVGVLPESSDDWRFLGALDLFRPLALTDKDRGDRASPWVRIMGRRSDSLTRQQAEGFIATVGRRLAADFPDVNAGSTWRTLPLETAVAPDNGPAIFAMLMGLSAFVLLIACFNLANLLLARTMARAREFAVRSALGASWARLLRPLLAESLLLAFAGGIVAIDLSMWTNDWLRKQGWGNLVFAIDWRVLFWAFGACLFTVVAFGVAPALFTLRLDLNKTLKSGGRGTTGGKSHQRFRHALIIGQFAFALVLLAASALLVRGLNELNERHYGWDSRPLVTGTVLLPATAYPGGKEINDFQRLALERIEAVPGIASASFSYALPYFGLAEPHKYVVAGREIPEPGHEPVAVINGVSPRYFETVGTPLISGRAFSAADTLDSPKVFMVNRAMATGLFGDESPIGQRLARAGEKTLEWGEIVGVVGDTQAVYPDRATPPYQLYQPLAQEHRQGFEIAVRAYGVPPDVLVGGVRAAMAVLDDDLPVRDLQPAEVTIARVAHQWQVLGTMITFLAVLGLTLASLGMYGVVTRTVAQRTGEFGIRLALGAQVRDIISLVLTSGTKLALVGSALGLLGAFGISRVLGMAFPNMHPNSPGVLSGATLGLMAIALVACYVPARYASKIDPIETLRAE